MNIRCAMQGLVAGAVILAAGCVGVVQVKDVQSDKFGYLAKTFSLAQANGGVVAALRAKDAGTLPFQKMILSVKPTFETFTAGVTPPDMHVTWTLINAGGPFVQVLDEESSNGVAVRQNYALNYRNLFAIRYQTLLLSNPSSSFVLEMKSLKDYLPLQLDGSGSGALDAHYQWGNPIQIANLSNLALHCEYGDRFAASKISPKFQGDAQEMKCESTNANGITSSHEVRALLLQYGVTVMMRNQTATATVSFAFEDVQIL